MLGFLLLWALGFDQPVEARAEKTEEGNGLVYFGNGPFAHLQHDFANLELEKRVFKRNLSQVTSLAGYAGSEPRVGGVCYNTSDERDHAKLGFAEVTAVRVAGEDQFRYLVSHFLKTFHGPEGARDRPQPEQKGLQFRSCIGIPGGREGTLFSTIQRENANFSMDLRVGGGKDPDAFNVIWIYDTTSFPFLRAEQYLQFVRDSDDDDDKKYHGCLRNLQLHQGVIEPTGCPEWSPPGTQVSDCSDKPKTMPELCRPSHGHLSPSLRWGISADLKVGPFTAEAVCCANHRFAEEPHFWSQNAAFVAAAKAATEKNPLVFFDSACDVPLFKAPVGRNTSQWLEESAHGWPSFRSQEMVSENLVTFAGGEVQSRCGTHLGHNLPDAKGDRYCIDLVCIAGEEASVLAGKPSMQNSEFEVYFGCGRFNHVQHEFVLTEVEDLHRGETSPITARAAYAGSKTVGDKGMVCFHNSQQIADYEDLGHAQVVQISCNSSSDLLTLAKAFFELCPKGSRRDAENLGAGYRSVIGIPGGMKSSLIGDLQKEAGRVSLIAGQGGDGDNLHEKTVYVYDTTEFPAHLAEEYLQFQDDMSRIYNKVKAELTLAESGSLCPGAELYIPWANIGIFVAVTAAVVFLARIGCKLDWPGGWGRRQISSMKSGRASLIEADVEESYQGLDGPSIEDSQLVNRS